MGGSILVTGGGDKLDLLKSVGLGMNDLVKLSDIGDLGNGKVLNVSDLGNNSDIVLASPGPGIGGMSPKYDTNVSTNEIAKTSDVGMSPV